MSMAEDTILFRARVPAQRLKKAAKFLYQLGLKPGDAFNILLAQIELRKGLPFGVTAEPHSLLSVEEQAGTWSNALGPY
jgi:antitoxin component of RelBE/YafQ-DinJ toxin-antitoxin module